MYKNLFPFFKNNPHINYLDNAATTHKLDSIVNTINSLYTERYATVNRTSSVQGANISTDFDNARITIAQFINADPDEIIFVQNTTDALNFASYSLRKLYSKVFTTYLEHKSNYLPWQRFYETSFYDSREALDNSILTIPHISNTTGMVLPVKELAKEIHAKNGILVVDGAQGIAHQLVDVKDLDCDMYAFSGHKLYGPVGIGVLYIKRSLQDKIEPYRLGDGEHKFEAGTPNFIQVIALAEGLKQLATIGMKNILEYETTLFDILLTEMNELSELNIIGNPDASIIGFTIDGVHPLDIAEHLASQNIAIRAGHHCAPIAMEMLEQESIARVSLGMYNTLDDIYDFLDALDQLRFL